MLSSRRLLVFLTVIVSLNVLLPRGLAGTPARITEELDASAVSDISAEPLILRAISANQGAAKEVRVLDLPLKIRIFVPPGKSVPDELHELIRGDIKPVRNAFQEYACIPQLDKPDLQAIVNHPDVDFVEVERPLEFEEFIPVPFNEQARISHLVPQFAAEFPPANAANVIVAVFDGGAIRKSHVEFQADGASRVSVKTAQQDNEHATHVAGTIAARGAKAECRGMAPGAKLQSFDFLNDSNEMETLDADVGVTNHSYGPVSGWDFDSNLRIWRWWGDTRLSDTEDAKFGKYTGQNTQVDDFLHRHGNVVSVVAAGNDRNDQPLSQPIQHATLGVNPATGQLSWLLSTKVRPKDGGNAGFDTISGLGLCKNTICIGAVHDVPTAATPIITTDFSGYGPTDDGRIKPDLVANGYELLSTSSSEDDAYVELSGTSMASPTASGICALLTELFQSTHGRRPSSAEIKAALIHTARDAGPAGPDPAYGWGSLNALRAGRVVAGKIGSLDLIKIPSGTPQKLAFKRASGLTGPIRATVVWIDPPASQNSGGVDDATPVLVNDIDLQLISPTGEVHLPYSLSASNPLAVATATSQNRVDNVEVVDAAPVEGDWTIEITATTLRVGSEQECALVVSGLKRP